MRRTTLVALAFLFSGFAFAQTVPSRHAEPPGGLPKATAEPEDAQAYAPPMPREREGPSPQDRGPMQRFFVLASGIDDLGRTQVGDNASLVLHEKVALDKRIRVPLIHDVQDDASYRGAENHALLFEVKYLNWGAVTGEQLRARQGHYFTITWVNHGPPADFTTRFEYRQVKSKQVIRTLIQDKPHAAGATRSYFGVVGLAYLAYGPVSSWRFTVLRDDVVVAEAKSFIW